LRAVNTSFDMTAPIFTIGIAFPFQHDF